MESLLGHADARIVRYASGALRNIATSLGLPETEVVTSELALAAINERAIEHQEEARTRQAAKHILTRAVRAMPPERRRARQELGLRRRRLIGRMDTESACSGSTWSYEIGPFVRSRDGSRSGGSRTGSRPSSACSHASSHEGSHASSYRSAVSHFSAAPPRRTTAPPGH